MICKGLFRSYVRDRAGATAVEFAIVGAPLLMTLCAIFAIGLNFFMVMTLNHAVSEAGRQVAMGNVSTVSMSASDFRTKIVCPMLPSIFVCSNVFVNLTNFAGGVVPSPYNLYVNAGKTGLTQPPLDSTKDTFCAGSASKYVVLQVIYPAPYFFSFLTPSQATTYNGQKVALMTSAATFKAEPYPGTVSGC